MILSFEGGSLDRKMWRARFGRGFGPVVRQTAKWMTHITLEAQPGCLTCNLRNPICLRRDSCNLFSGPLPTRADTSYRPEGFFSVHVRARACISVSHTVQALHAMTQPTIQSLTSSMIYTVRGWTGSERYCLGTDIFWTWRHRVWYTCRNNSDQRGTPVIYRDDWEKFLNVD
jgi:hypothetical protein